MRPAPRKQSGFSLPELMVAMALGLLVVGAVFLSYAGTVAASRQQGAASDMTEAALLALAILRRDLQMAAYVHPDAVAGDRFEPMDPVVRARPVFGCRQGFVQVKAPVGTGVCQAGHAGSDAIEINFEASYHAVDRDGSDRLTDCQGAALDHPAFPGTQAPPADPSSRLASTHRYFVDTPAGASVPHLYCASARSNRQPLVPHVQELRLSYGVAHGWDPTVPGSQRPVRYVRAHEVGNAAWSEVVAVHLCVLMRSDEPVLDAGEVQTHRYIDCEGNHQMSHDRHLRRAFTTTVGLRNREIR